MADLNQNATFDEIPSSSSGFNFTSKTALLWLKREILQAMCAQNGLVSTGTKEQLADRLVRFYTDQEAASFPSLDEVVDEDEDEAEDLEEALKQEDEPELAAAEQVFESRSADCSPSLAPPMPMAPPQPMAFSAPPQSAVCSPSRAPMPLPTAPPQPMAFSAPPQSEMTVLSRKSAISKPAQEKSKFSISAALRNVKPTISKEQPPKEAESAPAQVQAAASSKPVTTRVRVVALCCEGSGEDSFTQLLKGKEAMSITQESPSVVQIELAKIKCPIVSSSTDKDAILSQLSNSDVVVPLLTKNAMTVEAFLFGIENAKKLHKRIILVHDKGSCDFPSHKPDSIKDVFDQIAVTLIGQYSTRCWEKIISRIQTSESVKEEVDLEVFLSHRQKTGQGIALALYNELQRRASTENKVFLDVKAQFTLHDLELLVSHTKLFVFIVTKGIFTESAFCFIEFETAVKLKKWMVIVWDLDYKLSKDMLPMKWAPYQHILYDESITAIYNATYIEDCVNKILEIYHKHALQDTLEQYKGSTQMKQAEKVAKSSWSKLTPEKRKQHLKEHPLYAGNAVEFHKLAEQASPPQAYTEVILWKSIKKK